MNVNPKDELEAAQWHLNQAIEALLKARDARHLGKLGAARYEISETLIKLGKEVEANAPTSRVG
ncbi:hypothetical protein D3C71_1341500 [compost metagenome]